MPFSPLLIAACLALASTGDAQTLPDITFGTPDTFDVVTWNIEWFPKNGQTSSDAVREIIDALDADLLALQEITDTAVLQQVVDSLPTYDAFYQSAWFAGLAYVYNSATIQIQSTYEIYTTAPYWSPFPRSPVVMELTFNGEDVVVINNHFKCCGDGILDLSDPGDEETRRYTASNLLKNYIGANFSDKRVIVLGDLNDSLTDSPSNNVFQSFTGAPTQYSFADDAIANGSSADWSYPSWPSHLDHILITNELFDEFADAKAAIETIRVDDYLPGGWSQYNNDISDHRPVGLRVPIGNVGPSCPNPVPALAFLRLGAPPNPNAFASTATPPAIGNTWNPEIDHTSFAPTSILDVAIVTTKGTNLPSVMGTILCDLSSTTFMFPKAPQDAFAISIPPDCALSGLVLYAQGASIDATGISLTNGLDVLVGTY